MAAVMIEHRRRGATNQVLLGFAMVMIGLPWLMVAETEGPPRTLAEGDSTRPPALDLIGSAPVRSKPASSTSTAVVLPDRGRYEFRDVATDEVVPGLAFTSRAASSNSGLVAGDGPDAANMHLSDVRWALVSEAPSRDSRWALPAYWVGRRIRIHGRVLAAPGEVGPIDVGALRVTLRGDGAARVNDLLVPRVRSPPRRRPPFG